MGSGPANSRRTLTADGTEGSGSSSCAKPRRGPARWCGYPHQRDIHTSGISTPAGAARGRSRPCDSAAPTAQSLRHRAAVQALNSTVAVSWPFLSRFSSGLAHRLQREVPPQLRLFSWLAGWLAGSLCARHRAIAQFTARRRAWRAWPKCCRWPPRLAPLCQRAGFAAAARGPL